MIMAYVSEQTNSRRPGLRLTCTCGWSIIAVYGGESVELAEMVDRALEHTNNAHGIDEIRGRSIERGR